MIPANHDSRIEAQQLPRERFSPLAELRRSPLMPTMIHIQIFAK